MKKQVATVFLLIMATSCFAQKELKIKLPLDSSTNKVIYSSVINVEGINKEELYNRAKEWFVVTYNSAKDVLQMDDKVAGKIIGKGTSRGQYKFMLSNTSYYLNYTLSVTLKDGRYRYEFSQFTVETLDKYSIGGRSALEEYIPYYEKEKGILYSASKKIIPHMDLLVKETSSSLESALKKSSPRQQSKDNF